MGLGVRPPCVCPSASYLTSLTFFIRKMGITIVPVLGVIARRKRDIAQDVVSVQNHDCHDWLVSQCSYPQAFRGKEPPEGPSVSWGLASSRG